MSGTGIAQNVYLFAGVNGYAADVSEGNALYVQPKIDKLKNVGRFVIRSASPTRLPDMPTSFVVITNNYGNDLMWIAGYEEDAPEANLGYPLREGKSVAYACSNLNQISIIAATDKQEIFVQAGLSGTDTDVSPNEPAPPDTTPPTIQVRSPASGATNQEWDINIVITMSEAMDPLTVDDTTVTFKVLPGLTTVPATVSLDSSDPTKIIIDPTSNLSASTSYRVTVTTGVKDIQENALAVQDTWDFSTKAVPPTPDTTPPTFVSSNPTDNATGITISDSITGTFSEALLQSSVTAATAEILLASNNQALTGVTPSLSADKKTITLTGQSLSYSTAYILRFTGGSGGIKDLAGNPLVTTVDIDFTTQSPPLITPYSVAGNTYDKLYDDNYIATALKIVNSSSSLYNLIPKTYSIDIHRYGSISGNYTIAWYRGSTLFRTLKTAAVSGLPNNAVNIVTIDDSTNTTRFATGDRIVVSYSGSGNSTNHLRVRISSVDAKDGSNTINQKTSQSFFFGTTTADYQSNDLAITIQCQA